MIRILVLLVTFLGFIFMPFLTTSGDEKPNWAIVIHGGAGSDPQKWNDAKTKIRETGLHRALTAGRDALANGGNALDTVELVIRILEDDAAFNAGRGAVLTKEGKVELDASIMDGKTGACGAVAGVTATRNPINLARLVMTQTPHVLLAGKGANQLLNSRKYRSSHLITFSAKRDSPKMNRTMGLSDVPFWTQMEILLQEPVREVLPKNYPAEWAIRQSSELELMRQMILALFQVLALVRSTFATQLPMTLRRVCVMPMRVSKKPLPSSCNRPCKWVWVESSHCPKMEKS